MHQQMKKRAVMNWSGGKDSALALYKVLQGEEYEVISLLTTIDAASGKSSIHSIPIHLLEAQANSIGIPLYKVIVSAGLKDYDEKMLEAVHLFIAEGANHFIFGDIFLEDIKQYRERKLNPQGISVVEPLWHLSATEVMEHFLRSGIRSKIVVTQADVLGREFIGRELNDELVKELPKGIDVCGENGEYHTFCYGGAMFQKDVLFTTRDVVKRSYNIKLDTGQTRTFDYWMAVLE